MTNIFKILKSVKDFIVNIHTPSTQMSPLTFSVVTLSHVYSSICSSFSIYHTTFIWMHFELNGRCQNPSDQTSQLNIFKVQYLFIILLSPLRSNLYTMKCINLQFTVWCVLTNTGHLAWLHRLGTQFRVQGGFPDLGAQWLPFWSGHKAVPAPNIKATLTPQLYSLSFSASVGFFCPSLHMFSTSAQCWPPLCVCHDQTCYERIWLVQLVASHYRPSLFGKTCQISEGCFWSQVPGVEGVTWL